MIVDTGSPHILDKNKSSKENYDHGQQPIDTGIDACPLGIVYISETSWTAYSRGADVRHQSRHC
jgi:hypothetical protein